MKDRKKEIVIAGGSFIVGFAVGVVTNKYFKQLCRESLISEKSETIRELKNQQKEFMAQVNHKLANFRNRVRKELHEPIPDLYKATEGLTLDVRDIEIEH